MIWKVVPVDPSEVTPEYLYELHKRHRLVPEALEDAVGFYTAVAPECVAMRLENEDGETVADLLVMNCGRGVAELSFIPCPKFFAPGEEYEEPLREALGPVLEKLARLRKLRRIQAFVPKTRSRTFQALRACGFDKEGVMRELFQFRNKPPEGAVTMGYLPGKEK